MNNPVMTTKAETLYSLVDVLNRSKIQDMIVLSVGEYVRAKRVAFHIIAERFKGAKIVVRSSAKDEDNFLSSNAGQYTSILNVDSSSLEEVYAAIWQVMESYVDGELTEEAIETIADEQILIQKQLMDVQIAGVAFTRDIIHNRPYYMINYTEDGSTTSVTGGKSVRTRFIAKNVSREFMDERFLNLYYAIKEIEQQYKDIEGLDIEFALDSNNQVWIFQVRPLAALSQVPRVMTDREFVDTKAFAKCHYLDKSHVLSDMAYWNPSENIGTSPRPLDYSLFRTLITSKIWNQAIRVMGYETVEDELMQKVGNKPYISLQLAFEGLTPRGLDRLVKYKLMDYYLGLLEQDKTAHDKIEFEIAFHMFDFSTDKRLVKLGQEGFSVNEIWRLRSALLDLTKLSVREYDRICENDKRSLEKLRNIRHEIRGNAPMDETNTMKLYQYLDELLKSIIEYGTPQFVRQARYAFMARCFCKSLVDQGYYTKAEMDEFQSAIPTVTAKFECDFANYSSGFMSKEEFDSLYGHFRYGTYDIRTDCYMNMNFDVEKKDEKPREYSEKEPVLDMERLQTALERSGLKINAERFVRFLIQSTQNRELFRFEYTKSLNMILELIIHVGDMLGIAREDMSYLEIQDFEGYHSRDSYIQIIESRRTMYHANSYLMLPEVIFSVGDIDVIESNEARPNYITEKVVTAPVVNLDEENTTKVEGKIVVLTKADPGYDWIFVKNIAGFVSKYGGAASHMAIRCAEFGVPAAIGCGEKIYSEICEKQELTLDCLNGKIH